MKVDRPQDETIVNDSATDKRRRTVLLVDDDAKLLRGLERSFSEEDYDLLTAVSAAEANVLLSKHHVDLVLSDNLMPGVLGTDFLANVRKQYPDIKLMILSGYIPEAAANRALDEIGVLRVLNKPARASVVASAIRLALSESSAKVESH